MINDLTSLINIYKSHKQWEMKTEGSMNDKRKRKKFNGSW